MDERKIGILAGMGPRSTAPFIDLVITECQLQYGAKEDIDFPKILIYSLPTPFYADRPINHNAMKTALCSGIEELEHANVDFMAIACNTAHIYYPELQKAARKPLLDVVGLTALAIPRSAKRTAIIASRPTIESNIYQESILKHGFEVVDVNWQSQVDELIDSMKTPFTPPFLKESWNRLTTLAHEAGADTVIIACLDLSAISSHIESKLVIVNASRCLAREIVRRWLIIPKHEIINECSTWRKGGFVLSTDKTRLQLDRVHSFLSTEAYWSLGIPSQIVQEAVQNSLCFGLFDEAVKSHQQVGFARVVTDYATFAWLCDVYVEQSYRGKGLAKWIMDSIMNFQKLKGLRRICLATKDAHALYTKYGFEVTKSPDNWMEIKDNDIYRKLNNTTNIV